ncbi:MAG: hypothetical protein ACOYIC_05760 [Butyricicoccus sp.]|jgi:hypothetical protein
MKHKSQLWKNLRLPLKRTAAMMLALAIVFTSMSVIIPSAWADEEAPAAAESAPTPAPEPAPAPTPTPAPEPTPEPAPAPETSNSDTVKDEGTEETTPDETPEENKTCEITVTVKDGTGSAVSGATVNGKTTDGDGKATLKVSKTGSYTLKASKSGYYDGSETIDASGDTATGTVVMDKKVEYYGKVKLQNAEGDPTNADAGDYKVKYTYKGNTSTVPDSDKSGSVYHFTMRQNKSYTLKVEAANSKKYKDADAKTIDISADMNAENAAETVLNLQTYSVSVGDHVSIVEGKKDSYHYGDKLTVKFDERDGYQLTGVSGGDFSKVKDNKLEITVEGDTKVEATYTKLYQVSVTCGENGGVKVNDKSVATGGTVEVLDGDKPSYEVKADNGYYIYSLKVGGETVVEADESKTHGASSKSGTFSAISGDTTIEAAFAETKYEVTVSLGNTTKASKISLTDTKDSKNTIEAGSSKTIMVGKSYLDESGYVLSLKVSAPEGYAVNYGGEQYVNGDTLTIKVTEDTSVALSVQKLTYTVMYHNPFSANRSHNYTLGTNTFSPKEDSGADEPKGFALKGWADKINGAVVVSDDATLKKWLAAQEDGQESYDLYAVYELTDEYTLSINGVAVSKKAVVLEDWNSEDVSLTASSSNVGTVSIDPDEISAPVDAVSTEKVQAAVTVTQTQGNDTYEWDYGEVIVTAQFDTEAPELTVTKGEDESYSAEADDGEGSGMEKISYAVLNDLSEKTDTSKWHEGTSYTMTEEDIGKMLLFRAEDKAGNVSYSIAVLGEELENDQEDPSVKIEPAGTSYTNADEKEFVVTITDKNLTLSKVYEFTVNGKPVKSDNLTKTKDGTQKCTANYVVDTSKDGEQTIKVAAKDLAKREGTAEATVIADHNAPTVTYSYQNEDNSGELTEESDTNKDTTLTVTVEDKNLKAGSINVSITKDEEDTPSVTVMKDEAKSSATKWVGTVTLSKDGTYVLSTSAEDLAGNRAENVQSAPVNISKDAPGILVTYQYRDKSGQSMSKGATVGYSIEATISVEGGANLKKIAMNLSGQDEGKTFSFQEKQKTWTKTIVLGDDYPVTSGQPFQLMISAEDKAGNEPASYTSGNLLIDRTAPTIGDNVTKATTEQSAMHWLRKDQNLEFSAEDKDSGVESIQVTLNGKELTSNDPAERTIKYDNKNWKSGENTITVTAKDKVGNVSDKKSYTIYKDDEAPTIQTLLELERKDPKDPKNQLSMVQLPFGNFYNEEAQIRILVTDQPEDTNSGVDSSSVSVKLNGVSSIQSEIKDAEVKATSGKNCYVVKLPHSFEVNGVDQQYEKITAQVTAKDHVGNTAEYKDNPVIGNADSSDILYETTAPAISMTGNCYKSEDELWVKEGQTLTLTADDTANNAEFSSGLKSMSVELNDTKKSWPNQNETNNEKIVTNSIDIAYTDDWNDGSNTIAVNAADNAGNSSDQSFDVNYDPKAPNSSLAFEPRNNGYSECSDDDGNQWYSDDDINVTATVYDNTSKTPSGLQKVVFKLNDGEDPILTDELSERKEEKEYSLNLSKYEVKPGENTITINATDNVGNDMSEEYKFYVDDTKPEISEILFEENVGDNDPKNNLNKGYSADINNFATKDKETVNKDGKFAYFFDQETKVTVTAKDSGPSAGIKKIVLKAVAAEDSATSVEDLYKKNHGKTYAEQTINGACGTNGTQESATFTIPANFKGWIYVYAEDNVDYISAESAEEMNSWTSLNGEIVETQDHHNDEPYQHAAISVSGNNTYTFGDGSKLYNGAVKVTFTVKDTYNGISRIKYSVNSKEDDKTPGGDVSFKNGDTRGWSVKKDSSTTAQSFISQATKTITVSNESNNITINLEMWDGSGNTSTDTITFHIDTTKPKIEVTMDQNDDPTYTGYFKTTRTGTIKITDRNFDPSKVKFSVTRDGGGFSVGSKFNGSGTGSATDGEKTYTMPLTFEPDGDYLFGVSCTDLANNTTGDSGVQYDDRGTDTKFTVDKTAPVITVDISGNRGKGNYYNQTATVTVTVHEHNYASERYTDSWTTLDSQTRAPSGSAPGDGAGGGGDVWTHTYSCNQELIYALNSLKVIDKAGNETTTAGGSYALGTEFIVDQSDPDFKLYTGSDKTTNLNQTATNEKTAAPVVIIYDTNLDTTDPGSYSVKLTGVQEHAGKEPGTNLIGEAGYTISTNANDNRTLQINLGNLGENMTSDNIEKADDIYTLTVEATDKAGRTNSKTAVFSLNRYGSTYMVNTDTQALLERYYSNQEQPIQIIQINAASISDQKLSMSKDSQTTKLAEGRDYTMTYNQPEGSSESGWYECIYDIGQTLFEQEATYAVDVSSNDHAKNTLNNAISKRTINLFDGKNWKSDRVNEEGEAVIAPVNFRIDKTKPDAGMQDTKKQYHSGSENIEIYASDDAMLDYVQVLVDEQPYVIEELNGIVSDPTKIPAEYLEDGSYTVNLKFSDSDKHRVKVVSFDKAGNNSEMEVDHTIQITTNLFRLWLGNPFAVILTIAAVLAVIALIYRKMKKNGGSEAAA